MAATYIPVLGADGNTYFFAITPVVINGVTVYVQASIAADPLTGASTSVTSPGVSGAFASAIQGISGGYPLPVTVTPNGSSSANQSAVLVGTTNTSLLSTTNTSRIGFVLYNEGPSVISFTYGPTTIINPSGGGTYSSQLGPGERPYIDDIPYYGIVSAIVGAGSTPSWVLVTELF